MLRLVGKLVTAYGSKLVLLTASLLVLEICVLYAGYRCANVPYPLLSAIEKALGCLMTLDTPATMEIRNSSLAVARVLGWLVSFAGWLLVPATIGSAISFMQSERMSAQTIVSTARQAAIDRGIRPAVADKFSSALADLLAEPPLEGDQEKPNAAN